MTLLDPTRFDTAPILKKVVSAGRQLAELKGVAGRIPNQGILINSLGMQEAKDSSEIESIVTTHDELYRQSIQGAAVDNPAAKEVLRYRHALHRGFVEVKRSGLLTCNNISTIQAELEENNAGFRKTPGTTLQEEGSGKVIYTPPQDPEEIIRLMADLERFINDNVLYASDPLIKMAIIHHQFESIHPFYEGNGRTGRIVNILYLVKQRLLEIPVLYLSRYIIRTKAEYYRLLQAVRTDDAWEDWVLYLLTGIEQTAAEAIAVISQIEKALLATKHEIRDRYKFYSQDLINNIFTHPYTRIQYVENELKISRLTAIRYLEALKDGGFLEKKKVGNTNYFINRRLVEILTAG